LKNAKEVLALHLYGMEQEKLDIPEPTRIEDVKIEKGQTLALVEVFMPLYRIEMAQKLVRKQITLPAWLCKLADQANINYSMVCQDALINALGINPDEHQRLRIFRLPNKK
jgi:hypothetical protein